MNQSAGSAEASGDFFASIGADAEAMKSLAIQACGAGFWIFRTDSPFLFWDATTRGLFGYDLHAPISFEMALCRIHPEDRDSLKIRMEEMMGSPGDDIWDMEFRILHPERGERWMHGIGRAARDETGKLLHVSGLNIEITERKCAEIALRESEMRIRQMYHDTRDGVISVDMDGTVQECNPAFEQMVGYSFRELQNMTFWDLTPEKWHETERFLIRSQTLEKGYCGTYEKEYRHKNGEIFPIELSSYLVRDSSGNPSFMWAFARDITEKKKSDNLLRDWNASLEKEVAGRTADLRRNQARFVQLVEASFEGIAIVCKDHVIDANSQFAELFGCRSDEVVGRLIADFISADTLRTITRHITTKRGEGCEFLGVRKDGSVFPAEVLPRRAIWDDVSGWIFAIRDLTQLKRLETERAAHEVELEHTRGVALISEVSAGIIHQISQPLSSAAAHLSCAANRIAAIPGESGEILEIIRDVQADVATMKQVVTHLRKLCSFEASNLLLLDTNEVLAGALRLLNPVLKERGLRLDISMEPALPVVSGDAVQLGQMFFNLIRNAIDACDDLVNREGCVTVATSALPGNGVEILVCDNGTGMPAKVRKKLFTPFFSTKSNGLGIGLRLCQTIAHSHGGTIEVLDDTGGTGTVFRITLPSA